MVSWWDAPFSLNLLNFAAGSEHGTSKAGYSYNMHMHLTSYVTCLFPPGTVPVAGHTWTATDKRAEWSAQARTIRLWV